ncbi:MAG: aspartokinase [Cyclobacteriaceae bacterium]|nr:MAG: aspartokinase [Cyclobacteriaceae bacterium]
MKVFKFGGASVRDAQAVKNLRDIIGNQGMPPLTIVVSAMGKSTNLLEKLLELSISHKVYSNQFEQFKIFHNNICQELFNDPEHLVFQKLKQLYAQLSECLENPETNTDKMYDRVVSYGELSSTLIVHTYLISTGIDCQLLDARDLIKTDSNYREGNVKWDLTGSAVNQHINQNSRYLTQGFIAMDEHGHSITLGREGSDFTAAILASCLNAESVTIWKDVPGVLNADPDLWKDTVKYDVLSYGEAAEMTYYGASVIHPKTIRPLAVRKIPLLVKSFYHPQASGTMIMEIQHEKLEPAIIFKKGQCLISFQMRDFSFINQSKLNLIFRLFEQFDIQVNMMQSSAISFSVSVDSPDSSMKNIINSLSEEFEILYNDHLELITIKNYRQSLIPEVIQNRIVLLEQKTRKNYQVLVSTRNSE